MTQMVCLSLLNLKVFGGFFFVYHVFRLWNWFSISEGMPFSLAKDDVIRCKFPTRMWAYFSFVNFNFEVNRLLIAGFAHEFQVSSFLHVDDSSPFRLQISASIRKRPLRATWGTIAAATLPAAAVHEPTLLFVAERGFWSKGNQSLLICTTSSKLWHLVQRQLSKMAIWYP